MGSKYSATPSSPSSPLSSHNQEIRDDLCQTFDELYGDIFEKHELDREKVVGEYIDHLIDVCSKNNATILYAEGTDVTIMLEGGQTIDISWTFLMKDSSFSNIANPYQSITGGESLDTLLNTVNRMPDFLKTNFLDAKMKSGKGNFYGGGGSITWDSNELKWSRQNTSNMRGTAMHEISHSFDLGTGKINNESDFKKMMNNALSSSKGFQDIIKHEYASMYSTIYKKGALPSTQENIFGKDATLDYMKYGTESFAEAMKVTGQMKLFGKDEAWINVPVFDKGGEIVAERTVNYDTWKEINPNLARVTSKVWDSGSYEEAKKIMNEVQYDSTLKSKPLTEENYNERSKYITH